MREVRERIGPGAAALEPAILRARRYVPPPPLLPAPVAAVLDALGLARLGDVATLAMHLEGDRVLAYHPGDLP